MTGTAFPLIAVDIGNSRIKCGFFPSATEETLPEPLWARAAGLSEPGYADLDALFHDLPPQPVSWWIGSVQRLGATRLIEAVRSRRPGDAVRLLGADDLPLRVALPRPDMVGIDRLLDAVAANQLRRPGHAAVVVDVGSAITVDLVSDEGVFLGGAILPGIAMSARALHTFTDLLPWIDMSELTAPPPAVGTATDAAMRSGLFWGTVGAIRQLVAEMARGRADDTDVVLTGGAGPSIAALIGPSARHAPHLTLSGIVIAVRALQQH